MRIAVLGISGMLGSKMFDICQKYGLETIGVNHSKLDAENPDFSIIEHCEYIINCIGIIKPYINSDNSSDIIKAIKVNSLFPHKLAQTNKKIIQIATDCVWNGKRGKYLETDPHDAEDIYGKTKSLGEVSSPNFLNFRCSIIGPEIKGHLSLLEWFLHQPKNAEINGYKNHFWNGLTTEAFSKICVGIIKNNSWFPGLVHIVPADTISKSEMLHIFAKHFNREDIKINDINTDKTVDRTIATNNPLRNAKLWHDAGYNQIPSIKQMIEDIN